MRREITPRLGRYLVRARKPDAWHIFYVLAETYWGAFISGDQVTLHWDYDCACGWKDARLGPDIRRFSKMEGGDDKITCAGSTKAYNEFMDYVQNI